MRPSHLGLVRRDRPQRLVEIEVAPFGMTQFAGPHEHVRQELQRRCGVGMPFERLDGAKQATCFLGTGDCGAVDRLGRDQCAAQVGGNVAFSAGRGDGVAEHLAACAAEPLGRLLLSPALHLAQHDHQLLSGDRCDGALADGLVDEVR